jgi:hypothetical protein
MSGQDHRVELTAENAESAEERFYPPFGEEGNINHPHPLLKRRGDH